MSKELGHSHHNRGIKPLNRHPQLLGWELFILGPVQVKLLASCNRHSFDMVYLLQSHVSFGESHIPATKY